MPTTDILKLIFHHDQRLDDLAAESSETEPDPISMFTKPDPTYSTLYFSGSDLKSGKFGLNNLSAYSDILAKFNSVFEDQTFTTAHGMHQSFTEASEKLELNEALVISKDKINAGIIHSFTRKMLRDVLEKDWIIVYKREAKNGFDLHFFSKNNIYTSFFYPLQNMLPECFRFFSINGKRLSSEKQFYFETYTLHRPPHGFEEVFPESVL